MSLYQHRNGKPAVTRSRRSEGGPAMMPGIASVHCFDCTIADSPFTGWQDRLDENNEGRARPT